MTVMTKNADHGTPARHSAKMVSLEIDGQAVSVPEGTSIMRAASLAGITIPRLCATDSLESYGSCRLCLIEVEGRRGTPASCTTPVADGIKVITENERLNRIRKGVMELYISDHPLDCLTCSANGNCELQDMAGVVGLRQVRYGDGHNHLNAVKDESNPYFSYDPSKCIVCNRCVRACQETQGTFALTIDGRGFESRISPGQNQPFMDSECVSCGACVQACPTATLMEKSVIEIGQPEHSVVTTCAYCGVGCSFRAEVKGDVVVRMVPDKNGGANEGHSCVKGRFAWGYATHADRQLKPMIREKISDPWREVSWDEAIAYSVQGFKTVKDKYGSTALGGITSSRTTNEEVYAVQKMVRAAFRTNNIDTCARVCHSPTGFGLNFAFGTSAGTQDFQSVDDTDVMLVIGANPTDAHPVFGSRMKKRIRDGGAKVIVVDPRAIDLVKSAHIEASYHLQLQPGTNVAVCNAMAHVIMAEGLHNQAYIDSHCDLEEFAEWREFILDPRNSPEALESATGVPADKVRGAARLYATGGNAAIYYGLGVTEHTQGTSTVMAIANLAMITGNIGRPGVGVNPLRGQNNVQGSCDMGSFPHEFTGYRHVSDVPTRKLFEEAWGVPLESEPGLRLPNMFDAAIAGTYRGVFIHGEDIAQSDPDTHHVTSALSNMDFVVVLDLFLNETAKYAHVFLPGTSFLEKDGTFTNAERRINRVRPVMAPKTGRHEWQIAADIATGMGYPMGWNNGAEIMDEIARLTPTFAHVSFKMLDERGSVQWPCNEQHPDGSPIMHQNGFAAGKGHFALTEYVPTDERTSRFYPLILTTGRILAHYNVGTQTRRTGNIEWHDEDILEIHPHDAEARGIKDGDPVSIASRMGATTLTAKVSLRVAPGVVHTTFHHPESNANLITTENSDWATNCPEYKVTAVQVAIANQAASEAAE